MTFEKVRDIICEILGKPQEKVTLESNIVEDLGADSLDAVEMLMAMEYEFSITLPDEVCAELKTVKEIVDFIDANAKKHAK